MRIKIIDTYYYVERDNIDSIREIYYRDGECNSGCDVCVFQHTVACRYGRMAKYIVAKSILKKYTKRFYEDNLEEWEV